MANLEHLIRFMWTTVIGMQICLIRSLAFDENKAERTQRGLDLGCLDSMSWPEYVWEYLYMHDDDLRQHRQGQFLDHSTACRLAPFLPCKFVETNTGSMGVPGFVYVHPCCH